MQKADSPLGSWRGLVVFLAASLLVVADLLTKTWVRSYPEGLVIHELGFLRLVHVQNTGAAFGLFQGHSFILVIVDIVGIAVLLALVVFFRGRYPFLARFPVLMGMGMMLAGTTGNLIDRVWLGHVTDFLDVGVWPAFNIADSSIVVGAIIVAYCLIRMSWAEKGPEPKE